MCFHDLPALNELGSHALNSQESLADTTGNGALNAAAYELYLLLDCKVENTTLGGRSCSLAIRTRWVLLVKNLQKQKSWQKSLFFY